MKFFTFCRQVYHPGVHFYFSLNWFFAFFSILCINHDKKYVLEKNFITPVLTLFFVLLFLRIIDEIKDFDYDKMYNPARPLVQGLVTFQDLNLYLCLTAMTFLLLNLTSGSLVILVLVFEILYSTLLILLEKKSVIIKNNIVINLIFTYPVNILLSIYILFFKLHQWNETVIFTDYLAVLSFALAFLNYEFCRKIRWPHQEAAGERTYSSFFGTIQSKIISDFLGVASLSILVFLTKSWILIFGIFPILWGWKLLFDKKSITSSGSAFLGIFYGICIMLGIL